MDEEPVLTPDSSGIFEMTLKIKPVSSQAARQKKVIITSAVKRKLSAIKFVLTGDVAVEIRWLINPDERYETDNGADVDNIIKPILDALCGPDGIIIDDCQVQSISSYWLDRDYADERIDIIIRFDPEAYHEKGNIIFVQFDKALCFPIKMNMTPSLINPLLDHIEERFKYKQALLNADWDVTSASLVMPIQRFFHRTRLNGFTVYQLQHFRSEPSEK